MGDSIKYTFSQDLKTRPMRAKSDIITIAEDGSVHVIKAGEIIHVPVEDGPIKTKVER